jgi:predicted ArsR family transcriptional regulator
MTEDGSGLAALSGLDDPVRRRLYEFVSGRADPVGRDEAAAAAGISRPLAAYHLDKLVGLGLLTASYQRPPGRRGPGAGRPAKVYARSGREFAVTVPPREYELAARLLTQAVESDDGGKSRTALHEAARQFGAELGRHHRAAGARPGGVPRAIKAALREHGFEPQQNEDGTVWLHNCPFHQLAVRHASIVCGMNLALIDGLVAGVGASGIRAALDPRQGRCCVVIDTGQPTSDIMRRAEDDELAKFDAAWEQRGEDLAATPRAQPTQQHGS